MLICLYLAGYVSPQSNVFFSFFALGAPFIYLLNILLLLYWIYRWRVWAIVIAIPLLGGIGGIGNFIQLSITKEYDSSRDKGKELCIVTYNTHRMGGEAATMEFFSSIIDSISNTKADIVCLQEFFIKDSSKLNRAGKLFKEYPYQLYQGNAKKSLSHYRGLVVLSKYPIVDGTYHQFPPLENGFLQCDIIHRDDTISLFNTHLQTTSFNVVVGDYQGVSGLVDSENRVSQSKQVLDSLANNFKLRAIQADSLVHLSQRSSKNIIILGDFNSPPMSYAYTTISSGLRDAFREQGSGYGSTYRALLGGIFRIDYLFYNDTYYDCIEYESPEWVMSDHKPVIVTLKQKN